MFNCNRGQTRLRCTSGWTSAAAANGSVLFQPAPTPLESVSEEGDEDDEDDDGTAATTAALSLLYDPPGGTTSRRSNGPARALDDVEAAVHLAMAIEAWLSDIPIGGDVPRRFDSAGLIQFGIEKRLFTVEPAEIYERYVESMVADAAPPTPTTGRGGGGGGSDGDRGGGWHGDGEDDHPLL
eukprot:COSAG06_NODE_6686_length_2826_cov_2.453245_3_plen_182_part_00